MIRGRVWSVGVRVSAEGRREGGRDLLEADVEGPLAETPSADVHPVLPHQSVVVEAAAAAHRHIHTSILIYDITMREGQGVGLFSKQNFLLVSRFPDKFWKIPI